MGAKRKEREDDATISGPAQNDINTIPFKGSTLFVSNLPYTATSVDLQTLFSDIAPVRSAFVVLDKETGKSKGVGYVSFAIREDAAMAVDHIKNNGVTLDKRTLRVQFADIKVNHTQDKGTPVPNRKKPKLTSISTSEVTANPDSIRTIVISGLPKAIDAKALWKRVRKIDGAEKISQWPGKNASGENDPTVAEVLFSTPAVAQNAISCLHAHVFKGSLLSVILKKRLETLTKSGGNPSRSSRLIVRNLPWNTTEVSLRCVFLPYGPIHSVTIPVAGPTKEGDHPRAKGFGFVWMMNKSDAEKAIKGANGATLGGEKEGDSDAKEKERVIAVDWALSKKRWEIEKEKIIGAEHENSTGSKLSDRGGSDSDTDRFHFGVHEGSDRESDDEEYSDPDRSDDQEIADRPRLPPPETGNTIFIRNMPFDATEDELRTLFRAYGPLRYARITLDSSTGRSRGTGFVCFWNREDADKAIQQAELLKNETGGLQNPNATKKNPFMMSSILTHDPSSSFAQSLVMHGRTLDVTRAVTREEAGRLRELGEKQRQKQDKRNLYLMREGVIFPNTPSAAALTTADVEKRVQAFNTRRALLRSNPSLYISKTRLSVRQIPLFASERTLKRMALHAVRAFEEDVKKGIRDGLIAEELYENDQQGDGPALDGREPLTKKRKRKPSERYTPVRQVKIIRAGDRIDPVTGKGRSKGYGFVEMMSHADALRVLRWANNNPDVERLMKSWWKEESQDLLKWLDNGQKKTDEEQARIKRIKDRVQELEEEIENSKKTGRTLVLEFAIENIQVVRRRSERKKDKTPEDESSYKPKRKSDISQEDNHRPTKRARKSPPASNITEPSEYKLGGEINSIIGRKRRQKKLQRKA